MSAIRDVYEGLQILASEGSTSICAEHDIIYAGHDKHNISSSNFETLELLGWSWDEDNSTWMRFV